MIKCCKGFIHEGTFFPKCKASSVTHKLDVLACPDCGDLWTRLTNLSTNVNHWQRLEITLREHLGQKRTLETIKEMTSI